MQPIYCKTAQNQSGNNAFFEANSVKVQTLLTSGLKYSCYLICGLFFVNLPKVYRHRTGGVSGGDDAFFEAATVSRRVSTHRRCGKTCLTFSYVRYGDVFQNYAPLYTMAVFAWFCSKIMNPCYYKKVKYDSIYQ